MAGKVNTKFVVALSAGLLIVCAGVAGTAYMFLKNSAADNARAGDAKFAAGAYNDAADLYSRAVNKEQTNTEYLRKWVDALSRSNADTQVRYEKMYTDMLGAIRQLAIVQPDNVEAQRTYLDTIFNQTRYAPNTNDKWNYLVGEANTIVRLHDTSPPGAWEVLRRYRGLAAMSQYFGLAQPRQDMLDQAVADLKAALRADPSDAEVAVALADIDLRLANRARMSEQPEEAQRLEAQVDSTLSAFLSSNPDDPTVLLALIQRDMYATQRRIIAEGAKANPEAESKRFVETNLPILDRATSKARTMPMPLSEDLLGKFRNIEMMVVGAQGTRTEELTRASLRARPNDPSLMAFLADLLTLKGDLDGAMGQYESIAKLPIPPISFEGRQLFEMRKGALSQQAFLTLKAAQFITDPDAKKAQIDKARVIRETLAAQDGANSERLLLIDAFFALNEPGSEQIRRAAQLLDQYNKKTQDSNPEALFMAAQAARRLNEQGSARELFEKVLRVQPTNVSALMALGEIDFGLKDYASALPRFVQAARLAPDNEAATRSVDLCKAMLGQATASDPSVQALIEAQHYLDLAKTDQTQVQRAIDVLKSALAKQPTATLHAALASAYEQNGQRELAIRTTEDGLKAYPDDALLQRQKLALSETDPVRRGLNMIDASQTSPLEKELQRFALYNNVGDQQQAFQAAERAAALAPNDPRVVEILFLRALDNRDFAKAKEYADRAVRENLDQLSGDTYRGRLQVAQGNVKEGITILKTAAERGGVQPQVHRLLGRALIQDNRPGEAVVAFRQALRQSPTDVASAVDLLTTLINMGRQNEALTAAREYQKIGENDSRFLPLWLNVEAAVGDRAMAVARRESLARTNPGDRPNLLALALLHIEDNQLEKARRVIDTLKKDRSDLNAVILDANWHYRSNNMPAARQAFEEYLSTQDAAKSGTQAYLAYGSFVLDRGDLPGALEILDRARPYQNPKGMEIDQAVSDLMLRAGRLDQSLEATRRIVDAKADTPQHDFRKRTIELLTLLGRHEDAQKELDALRRLGEPDAVTWLLTAQLREAQKDQRGQLDALNQAVQRFPTNPLVFQRRAEYFMRDKATYRDAEQDLSRAIELAPDSAQLYQRRAQLRMQVDNMNGAIDDMRKAVRSAPRDSDLVFSTLAQLVRAGRDQEVAEFAADVASQRTRDASFLSALGAFFMQLPKTTLDADERNNSLSRRYFQRAQEIDPSDFNTLNYLSALLGGPRPDLLQADKILTDLGERAKNGPGYVMTQARIRMAQKRGPEAIRLAQESLRLIDTNNAALMETWKADLNRMLTDPKDRVQVYEATARAGIHADWVQYFRAEELLRDPSRYNDAATAAQQVAQVAKAPALKERAMLLRGSAHYSMGQYDQAAAVWLDALKDYPDNAELLNNAAYVLVENLNRPQEALSLAERAIQVAPSNADLLDTYGIALIRVGRVKEGLAKLEQGFARMQSPQAGAACALHLAEGFLLDNNKEGARRAIAAVDGLKERFPGLLDRAQESKLQELRGKME